MSLTKLFNLCLSKLTDLEDILLIFLSQGRGYKIIFSLV